MRLRLFTFLIALLFANLSTLAQGPELSKAVKEFVRVQAPRVVLTHVRIIDGTGAAAIDDQNLVIENGKIKAIEKGSDVAEGGSTKVLNLRGYSVMPGIVGMHNHLFYIARPNLTGEAKYEEPLIVPQMSFSAPRLYLAGGVTTMRTTGRTGAGSRPTPAPRSTSAASSPPTASTVSPPAIQPWPRSP